MIVSFTDEDQNETRESIVTSKLMRDPFHHPRMRRLKICKEEEITDTKAEQLGTHPSTANLAKSAIHGIIDVAWTLRKTSFIEDDARKLESDKKDLFYDEDSATTT